jgi:hypothetical protein
MNELPEEILETIVTSLALIDPGSVFEWSSALNVRGPAQFPEPLFYPKNYFANTSMEALSCTSKRFRRLVTPILFERVQVIFEFNFTDYGEEGSLRVQDTTLSITPETLERGIEVYRDNSSLATHVR